MPLYIHADDLGLARGITLSTLQLVDEGKLNSTSVVPNGVAFELAMDEVRRRPGLRLGIHLNLWEGFALLPPSRVPLLVRPSGEFRHSFPQLWWRLVAGPPQVRDALRAEIGLELRAQIMRVRNALGGGAPLLIDSHLYFHLIPGVLDALLDLHRELPLHYVRTPVEPFFLHLDGADSRAVYFGANLIKHVLLNGLGHRARRLLRARGIATTDHFIGVLFSGRMSAGVVDAALRRLPPRREGAVVEILFHPATPDIGEEGLWARQPKLQALYYSEGKRREAAALRSDEMTRILAAARVDGEVES